jgi:hypothetical protein
MTNNCNINISTCLINEAGQGWIMFISNVPILAGNINSYPSYFILMVDL